MHTPPLWQLQWLNKDKKIPAFGITQGGLLPTEQSLAPVEMTEAEEIKGAYELETGKVIVETFKE